MVRDDYYALLGIARGASSEEIKRAYRRLVRQWHPDLNPDLPDAAERLKRLNEAYRMLRDAGSDRAYDSTFELLCAPWRSEIRRPQPPPTVLARRRSAIIPMLITAALLAIILYVALTYGSGHCLSVDWVGKAESPHLCATKPTPDQVESNPRWSIWLCQQETESQPNKPISIPTPSVRPLADCVSCSKYVDSWQESTLSRKKPL